MNKISPLQQARAAYAPKLPAALQNGASVCVQEGGATTAVADVDKIQALFKSTFGIPVLTFAPGENFVPSGKRSAANGAISRLGAHAACHTAARASAAALSPGS